MCEYLYEINDGETKLIQQILHLLYIQKTIVNEKDSSYRLLFDTLGNNQKLALKIIG